MLDIKKKINNVSALNAISIFVENNFLLIIS